MKLNKEHAFQATGVAMIVFYLAVIKLVDLRFFIFFSCFSFLLMAMAFLFKLKNKFLNLVTISYLIVSIYLLARQGLWVAEHGLDPGASFTYQILDAPGHTFPFWIHLVFHGLPVPLAFLVMVETRQQVNWKHFAIIVVILVAWSYTMDVERFVGILDFWIAYPLGLPLTFVYMVLYQRYLRPLFVKKWGEPAE